MDKSIDTESSFDFWGLEEQENGKWLLNHYGVSFQDDENIKKSDHGTSCIYFWMY